MTSDLERQARVFAQDLQKTLNGTICQYVRIKAVLLPFSSHGPMFTLGSGLSKSNPARTTVFPLGIDNKKPGAWMNLSYQVRMDDEQQHLTVHESFCGIFADEARQNCLCHFDYQRDKERYASAHVQVYGRSPALEALNRDSDPKRPLEKLHIPVGGKRFRPSIEDIIEFLIAERLVDGRDGWERVVQEGRDRFQRIQLRAAMRRNTALVEEFMREQEKQES